MIIYIGIGVLIAIIAVGIWLYSKETCIVKIKKGTIVDFKSAVELTGVPIITFTQGDKKFNFIVDTGSNVSYISNNSGITYNIKEGVKEDFIGAGGTGGGLCNLGTVKLNKGNKTFSFTIRIADLDNCFEAFQQNFGVHIHGLLGNDVMSNNKYCIDFKEYIIYERK